MESLYPMANRKIILDYTQAEHIWLLCLSRAVRDLSFPVDHLYASHDWFISNVYGVGTYTWVCHNLGKDARVLRNKYRKIIYQNYL